MTITNHLTGRKYSGRRPLQPTQLERVGVIPGTVATVVEGESAGWRSSMYAALRAEARNDHDHPKDVHHKHRWTTGTRLIIHLNGKLHLVKVLEQYEVGGRLRYKIAFVNGQWLALTQCQLLKLMEKTIHQVLSPSGSKLPPVPPVGTQIAASSLPPMRWFGQLK